MRKLLLTSLAVQALCLSVQAQSGTNSPYSQFGLGQLADGATGFNKGMGGVGTAISRSGYVNTLNPASFASIDSLTFIFDVGLSGQVANFKEGSTRLNARNADFEYAVAAFRVAPHVGMSFGVMPLTNIGYSYASDSRLTTDVSTVITETYSGEGGLHRAYLGIGWEPVRNLSIGVTGAYLWGSYERSVVSSSTTYINAIGKTYSGSVNNYTLDLGAQWRVPLGKKDAVTLGATMGVGHKLGANPTCTITNTNSVTSETDDSVYTATNALSLPMTYAVGLAWQHGSSWLVAADVETQRWGSVSFPRYDQVRGVYEAADNLLCNSMRWRIGAEWTPNDQSRNYLHRVHYRLGAVYNTSYYKVKTVDGPKEYGLTAGFGLPIQNTWGGRSTLNVSAAWVHSSAKNLITENTFRVNVGITFNERWFQKWKVQ